MAKKVLIIEDRRENIVFIANKILKPEGWEVITARDGQLGLRKAIEEKPDVIITDLKLPKMHGLDVLEELNKRGFHIPAIVMTFHGSEETAIRAFRLGAADYLIKPFDIDEMMAAINRALQAGAGPGVLAAGPKADISEKFASQEREIQQLRSLLQEKDRALHELQGAGHQGQAGVVGTDTARWQALLQEKDATLGKLKKQMITQNQVVSQEINQLKAQLAEKEAIVLGLQSQIFKGGPTPGAQAGGGDLSVQLAEKGKALARAEKLVKTLAQTVAKQQKVIEQHRQDAERLARELHTLAAGIQMWGQSLGDQVGEVTSVLSKEE